MRNHSRKFPKTEAQHLQETICYPAQYVRKVPPKLYHHKFSVPKNFPERETFFKVFKSIITSHNSHVGNCKTIHVFKMLMQKCIFPTKNSIPSQITVFNCEGQNKCILQPATSQKLKSQTPFPQKNRNFFFFSR